MAEEFSFVSFRAKEAASCNVYLVGRWYYLWRMIVHFILLPRRPRGDSSGPPRVHSNRFRKKPRFHQNFPGLGLIFFVHGGPYSSQSNEAPFSPVQFLSPLHSGNKESLVRMQNCKKFFLSSPLLVRFGPLLAVDRVPKGGFTEAV